MYWDVTGLKIISDDTIRVDFEDGIEGEVNFRPSFFRGVFAHLKDPEKFREVGVVGGAVTWPGELDLAPDAMHRQIKEKGVMVLE